MAGGTVDAVVVGQAFHWFDQRRALDGIGRILRPGGALALLWNHDDEADPLVRDVEAALDRVGRPAGGSTGLRHRDRGAEGDPARRSRGAAVPRSSVVHRPEVKVVRWRRRMSVDGLHRPAAHLLVRHPRLRRPAGATRSRTATDRPRAHRGSHDGDGARDLPDLARHTSMNGRTPTTLEVLPANVWRQAEAAHVSEVDALTSGPTGAGRPRDPAPGGGLPVHLLLSCGRRSCAAGTRAPGVGAGRCRGPGLTGVSTWWSTAGGTTAGWTTAHRMTDRMTRPGRPWPSIPRAFARARRTQLGFHPPPAHRDRCRARPVRLLRPA